VWLTVGMAAGVLACGMAMVPPARPAAIPGPRYRAEPKWNALVRCQPEADSLTVFKVERAAVTF
jgi:hypothetical protein